MKKLLGNAWVESSLRGLSGAIGVLLLLIGLGFFIMPELVATALLAAEPARAVGINSLRGDFGGLFLGMSLFCLLGAATRHRWLLLVPIAFLALIVAGRLISLVADDIPLVAASALVSEVLFLLVLSLAVLSHSFSAETDPRQRALTALLNRRFMLALGIVAVLVGGAFLSQRQIGMRLTQGVARSRLTTSPIARLPDGLHIGLAGTGSPLPDARRRGACTFVLAGEHLFVVDSGPGSTLSLELMRVPLGDIEAVLLTHMHSDHIGDLGELMLKAWTRGPRTEPLRVRGPTGVETVVQGFNQAYSLDEGFRIAHHGPAVAPKGGFGGVAEPIASFDAGGATVIIQTEDLKVTAFLVDHRPVKPALGYRFDYKGRSVVISGDTLPSESLRCQAQGADLLLHEALQPELLRIINHAAMVDGQVGAEELTMDIQTYHAFPDEVARIARDAKVKHLVLHHLIPPIPMRILHSAFLGDAREIYPGPITIGVEGMVFSLHPGESKIDMEWLM